MLYEKEKQSFLSYYKSKCTKESYNYAFTDFENFCKSRNITPFECTPSMADKWIWKQRHENKSAATIRRNIAAVSSFFTYIERKSNFQIRNIFKGTRARPKNERKTLNKFYSMGNVDDVQLAYIEADIRKIIASVVNPEFKIIILMMLKNGLRCGSFEHMTIQGNQFKTISKEENIEGTFDDEVMQQLNNSHLKYDFSKWTSNKIKTLFRYYSHRLYEAKKIGYVYSCHDIRHYFALNEYSKNKDIYRLSKLLNHSSISITEKYLSGLSIDIKKVS